MNRVLLGVTIGAAVLSLLLLALGVGAFRKRRFLGGLTRLLFGSLFLALSALSAAVAVGTQGYRALTREGTVAMITTVPTGDQRFEARFRFHEGTEQSFDLAGDQIYVDAHILKWHPFLNLLGIHTAYELDRVGGRYETLDNELDKPRTIHSLRRSKPIDLFDVARRFSFLNPLVDAEYGSATFTEVRRPSQFELSVSTSGLLIRAVGQVVK